MFGNFTEEARKVLSLAKIEMKELKHPYVSSEHLLLGILKDKNVVSEELNHQKINYDNVKKEVISILGVGEKENPYFLYTPLLKRIIENAILDSKENNHNIVTIEHLFSSLLEEGEGVAIRILIGMGIPIDTLYQKFSYKLIPKKKKKNKKLFLLEFGTNLNQKAENKLIDPAIGREQEIQKILEILSRKNKNNPLLIGEAGVGKTAIAEELARRIVEGEVPDFLKNKTIISLDMACAIAGTKYRGEFEERIRKIISELEENDDIILFIDEVHTIVGAGGAEGAIDASNIFKPALARGKMKCIGATTVSEYKTFIENDKALERRFQKIIIEEPSKEKLKEILNKIKPIYEKYHQVIIKSNLIDAIINMSSKYIYDRKEPDRSIDVLDEVCAKVRLKESKERINYDKISHELQEVIKLKKKAIMTHDFDLASFYKAKENKLVSKLNTLEIYLYEHKKEVSIKDVALTISEKTAIPVYEILKDNKKIIQTLRKNLQTNIIGEDDAIESLMKIAMKIKLGYTDHKCYSILFTGPSGVGKTELSKIFARNFVGEKNIIKLDMSEFSESHSVSKLIGSPPGYVGYESYKNIFEEIKNKPNSVLILDEIEKAHSSVLNLFYQILDDSKIKDSKGNIIYFNHVIIIMTSNVGFLNQNIGFQQNTKTVSKLNETFEIPFINRVDDIVEFKPLTKEYTKEIIKKECKKLKQKYPNIMIDSKIEKEILDLSDYEQYGARKVKKIIKSKLESKIVYDLISDKNKENQAMIKI